MLARLIFFLTRRPTLIAIVLAWIGWLIWLWQPANQVRLHQRNFLKAVSSRNWDKAGRFISPMYVDRWNHDKDTVVREGREITYHFATLTVRSSNEEIAVDGPQGTVRARITLEGLGNPIAEIAKQQVGALRTPFEFDWKRTGSAPWDWELTRIANPELVIPESGGW